MFNEIINELLSKDPFKTELKDYILIHNNNLDIVPKGSHIKYITLNEEIKTAGTLLDCVASNNKRNSYLLIMGSNPWKLYLKYNFIFYKEKNNKISFKKYMKMIANNEIDIKIVKK
jgi:hypothetical protein